MCLSVGLHKKEVLKVASEDIDTGIDTHVKLNTLASCQMILILRYRRTLKFMLSVK